MAKIIKRRAPSESTVPQREGTYIKYKDIKFKKKARQLIDQTNQIIDEFRDDGYVLTLRQLYYQFVARDLIENIRSEYRALGNAIRDGRLTGLIDWDMIVDRTRELEALTHYENPSEILDDCTRAFRLDKWATQDCRVEVWIEKDALVGVISDTCDMLDVPYFSSRGYNSTSEMWQAAQRFLDWNDSGQRVVILYLGDHDPSGKDMTRDIIDRFLDDFGVANAEVKRIALNMDQIEELDLPPNRTKKRDPRAKKYSAQDSWELDALHSAYIVVLLIALMEPPEIGLMEPLESGRLRGLGACPI